MVQLAGKDGACHARGAHDNAPVLYTPVAALLKMLDSSLGCVSLACPNALSHICLVNRVNGPSLLLYVREAGSGAWKMLGS